MLRSLLLLSECNLNAKHVPNESQNARYCIDTH